VILYIKAKANLMLIYTFKILLDHNSKTFYCREYKYILHVLYHYFMFVELLIFSRLNYR